MSERVEHFEVDAEPRLWVSLPAGSVHVVAGEAGTVGVTVRGRDPDQLVIEQRGGTVYVELPRTGFSWNRTSYDVVAAVPTGTTDLHVKLASADLTVDAPLRRLVAAVSSGDVRAGDVADAAQVKVASGDVSLGHVGGRLEVAGASGDVTAESAGEADISLASGDVSLGRVEGRAQVNTAAGDVRIGSVEGRSCECRTVSGDVRLGIPAGRILEVDASSLAGDVRSELPPGGGGTCEARIAASVKVKSTAGDVVFVPAD